MDITKRGRIGIGNGDAYRVVIAAIKVGDGIEKGEKYQVPRGNRQVDG